MTREGEIREEGGNSLSYGNPVGMFSLYPSPELPNIKTRGHGNVGIYAQCPWSRPIPALSNAKNLAQELVRSLHSNDDNVLSQTA